MKSIGQILKEARMKKKLSLDALSLKTKIKKEFLNFIENENWKALPEFPVVLGFVKNISSALGLDPSMAAAFLKRDYPPQNMRINPKPDVSKNFVWSPKLTFLLGIVVVFCMIVGYLLVQYINFKSPPKLVVDFPKDQQLVTQSELSVSGRTESDAVVKVNNQSVLVDDNGNFSTKINVVPDTKEIVIVADSRSGKESIVKRRINVKLD